MGPPPPLLVLVLLLVLHCDQYTATSADFNVVIPEICSVSGEVQSPVNTSRIKEMVLLGIREDRPQLSLNIASQREICDKSSGLLEFIFAAKQESAGQMVGSLKPHYLCETAATLLHSQGRHFTSWTCPKMPGVVSIKPAPTDVILAINRLVTHLSWRNFGFAKLQADKSPYCDEIGSSLEQHRNLDPDTNNSIVILAKYEDVNLPQYAPVVEKLQGIFLCISYDHGFTHQNPKTERVKAPPSYHRGPLPLVLLPEWPLPLDVVMHSSHDHHDHDHDQKSRSNPVVLALLSHPHPYNFKSQGGAQSSSSSPEPEEAMRPSWESFAEFIPLEPADRSSSSKQRILEPLLARLILRSMKVSMEYDVWKRMRENEVDEEDDQSGPNAISRRRDDEAKAEKKQQFHLQFKPLSFRFLVFKFEKDRWHPVVNLVPGDNLPLQSSPLGERHHHSHHSEVGLLDRGNNRNFGKNRGSIVGWAQIMGCIAGTIAVTGLFLWGANYAREKYQNHVYNTTTNNSAATTTQKNRLVKRSQGPYKLLLTSRDICFSNNVLPIISSNKSVQPSLEGVPSTMTTTTTTTTAIHHQQQQNSLDPHSNLSFSRASSAEENSSSGCGTATAAAGAAALGSSTERPDLLKVGGVVAGPQQTLKKTLSIANMKNDSIILSENQARYKGDLVHLRKLSEPTCEPFEIKTKAMNVLETIHGLRHENLVALIGVLTEGIPAQVWEYCSRGSLHDIIRQQDIKLDWAFKLSLLTDLVRGMKYLHSSLVRVHGFLTSYNCVIDARWVLKITDYGVLSFHHNQGLPLLTRSNKELLWTAPELLREEGLRKHGTQPGDVYSFGIIFQEVLVRGEPYCMLNISTEEILEKVRKPPPLIRPSVSKQAAPPEAINIMRQCWNEIPEMRPDFVQIHDQFKTLNHGRKANIVDTMFEMLEKYSNNLEELIRERTEQLDFEKRKTEQLLNRMLPSTVAEKLKLGLPVDPEDFSEVTIYFSDIVGFTTISAYSTPFEVVDLLNDLYTAFDATINDYNVYKVETIGDAYMVVGGVPVRSPDHADQIATMALDLLHQSGRFKIRHLPYTPLRLRIGIHTGPCCAGVVGLTMPRYCLFGDTVNTASRMESTGAPWRIHISANTKSKLESIGGYVIEYRGITDIKGKGKMSTYWLLGREGFDKELPRPPQLNEDHGLDEKSILYGRTGIPPSSQETLNPKSVGFRDSRPNSTEGSGSVGGGSSNTLDPTKAGPTFSVLHGEAMRCLSPAEEVAHQLLNGRPAMRGLRRQFSLDQGSNYYLPLIPGGSTPARPSYRKTPSLEETFITDHNKFSSCHPQLSIEVPCKVYTPNQTSSCSSNTSPTSAFSFNSSFSPNKSSSSGHPAPPPAKTPPAPLSPLESNIITASSSLLQQSSSLSSDNKELHSTSSPNSSSATKVSASNKTSTLSPRTGGRIFIKSSSLTRVEESPTQE